MKNKHGQLTIFIILGIVIVSAILLAIYFMNRTTIELPTEQNPQVFIQGCVQDAVEKSVGVIMDNGGQIVPEQSLMYNGVPYNYLCYQNDYYQGCYNLHPMLEAEIEAEIKADTLDDVQQCFDSLRIDFENKGFDVSGEAASYSIDVLPGMVEFNLQKKIIITREGSSQTFQDFNGKILSPFYELIRVARDVVNSESQFCNFEYNGYMLLYPQYDIRRADYDANKIYHLIDRRSKEEFKFAVRSCAYPPGI